jgi:acetyltransferase-like isoleucine patch superfamily enzyme
VSHVIGESRQRAGKNVYSDIKVGAGTWIGANVVVLPGVTIGSGCVIAAGSVVIEDCEDNYLYAGNPARKKRLLN